MERTEERILIQMNHPSARRSMSILAGLLVGVTLLACEDKRVREVDAGISRDSAITLIAGGQKVTKSDTFPNVHRRSRYLVKGKEMEVLWFTATGKIPGKDTLPFRQLTPIVIYDGKVIGKGWDFWEATAKENNISVPPKDTTKK